MAYRKEKLEEQIKRIVSELLIREIKDPRIGFATITGVELSKDYSQAKIGVSVLGDPRDLRKTMEGLQSARPLHPAPDGKGAGHTRHPEDIVFSRFVDRGRREHGTFTEQAGRGGIKGTYR